MAKEKQKTSSSPVDLTERLKLRRKKLIFFYRFYPLLFFALVIGLFWRQVIQNNEYRLKERRQAMRKIVQPGPRGDILDRNGKLLVGNRPRFSAIVYLDRLRPDFRKEYFQRVRNIRRIKTDLHINQSLKDVNVILGQPIGTKVGKNSTTRLYAQSIRVKFKEDSVISVSTNSDQLEWNTRWDVIQSYLEKINKITGRNQTLAMKDLKVHFNHKLLLPLPLVEDLTLQEYARLIEEIPVESPIQIYTDTARYYPYSSAASHTLGYVSKEKEKKNENLKTFRIKRKEGKTGMEKQFDEILKGKSGGEVWLVDHRGFQYNQIEKEIPVQGRQINTSLDIDMQRVAEDAMGSKIGAVVALKVKTGEVLVLASKPNYDLNELTPFIPTRVFNRINDAGAWLNRATQGLYPPGSTFKMITAIAGLNEGKMLPETGINCQGKLWDMKCWNLSGHGIVNLQDSLSQSCNVYYYALGVNTKVEAISKTAKMFGLNDPTGIEIPNETGRMIVPDREWKESKKLGNWRQGDTANFSIGQGYIRVTPLQMACFTASFARKETLTKPTLLYQSKKEIQHPGTNLNLQANHYQAIVEGMSQAVTSGTAKNSRIPGLTIAAKTGTAQVPVKGEKLTIAWYVGYAPIENPEIAVCVTIEGTDPNDRFNGGTTAAPIAKVVLEQYKERYMN